jgi:hypothetical protein
MHEALGLMLSTKKKKISFIKEEEEEKAELSLNIFSHHFQNKVNNKPG